MAKERLLLLLSLALCLSRTDLRSGAFPCSPIFLSRFGYCGLFVCFCVALEIDVRISLALCSRLDDGLESWPIGASSDLGGRYFSSSGMVVFLTLCLWSSWQKSEKRRAGKEDDDDVQQQQEQHKQASKQAWRLSTRSTMGWRTTVWFSLSSSFLPGLKKESIICLIEWIAWSSTNLPSVTSLGELEAPLLLSLSTSPTRCRTWSVPMEICFLFFFLFLSVTRSVCVSFPVCPAKAPEVSFFCWSTAPHSCKGRLFVVVVSFSLF